MGILLALAFEAALENATIRVFEQADGPVLPFARRQYATRFDATRTRSLGVEISASYAPAAETESVPIDCALRRPDGSVSAALRPMEFQYFAGETQSHSANLLWIRPAAQAWPEGRYEIECRMADKTIGAAQFEVAVNPPEVADGDIRVAALRVFPVEAELPPRMLRRYAATLAGGTTARIGVELEFTHEPLGRSARIPVDCWFFWPDGQTSPPLVLSYEPEPDWAGGYSAGAMGWEKPGNWPQGMYTVSCAMHGQPVAVDRFELN